MSGVAASPGMARALIAAWSQTDVTSVLPSIGVPTLVLHRQDHLIPIAGGHALADAIPGARFVKLEGGDHYPFLGDFEAITDTVEEFLTGTRSAREPERSLSTVLFSDIVGSTQLAADLGDARWRELLQRHDELVDAEIASVTGRVVKHTGDGVLATFDGPARAVRCAMHARPVRSPRKHAPSQSASGVHTGEIELIGDAHRRHGGPHRAHVFPPWPVRTRFSSRRPSRTSSSAQASSSPTAGSKSSKASQGPGCSTRHWAIRPSRKRRSMTLAPSEPATAQPPRSPVARPGSAARSPGRSRRRRGETTPRTRHPPARAFGNVPPTARYCLCLEAAVWAAILDAPDECA